MRESISHLLNKPFLIIPSDKSQAFIKAANSRVLSSETLKKCAKSAARFNRRDMDAEL